MLPAQADGSLHLRMDAATSQSRRFKSLIGDFLGTEFRRVRPEHGAYEVVVTVERSGEHHGADTGRDMDDVARAVVDALSPVVFRDGSPVERLHVEKAQGERTRIRVSARPVGYEAAKQAQA